MKIKLTERELVAAVAGYIFNETGKHVNEQSLQIFSMEGDEVSVASVEIQIDDEK